MKYLYNQSLQGVFAGTISALKQYDDELQKYGAEIVGIRITDTSSQCLVFSLKITDPLIISDKSSIIHILV